MATDEPLARAARTSAQRAKRRASLQDRRQLRPSLCVRPRRGVQSARRGSPPCARAPGCVRQSPAPSATRSRSVAPRSSSARKAAQASRAALCGRLAGCLAACARAHRRGRVRRWYRARRSHRVEGVGKEPVARSAPARSPGSARFAEHQKHQQVLEVCAVCRHRRQRHGECRKGHHLHRRAQCDSRLKRECHYLHTPLPDDLAPHTTARGSALRRTGASSPLVRRAAVLTQHARACLQPLSPRRAGAPLRAAIWRRMIAEQSRRRPFPRTPNRREGS
eukprot:4760472-Pleurochrysis_carterae.AAC.1